MKEDMATTTTTPLSSHNFARILIGQLDDAKSLSPGLDAADAYIQPSEPATLDDLTQTVAVLDTEIQDAKVQGDDISSARVCHVSMHPDIFFGIMR